MLGKMLTEKERAMVDELAKACGTSLSEIKRVAGIFAEAKKEESDKIGTKYRGSAIRGVIVPIETPESSNRFFYINPDKAGGMNLLKPATEPVFHYLGYPDEPRRMLRHPRY